MRDKLLFIYNPNAGTRKICEKLSEVVNELVEEDCDLVISPTRKQGDAKRTVEAYLDEGQCKKVICSGGDGTLHEVINGMMLREKESRVPIVYIPAGSTNDFGYSLNIPKNIVEAARLTRDGMRFPCDIAQFRDEYFVYSAAFGLFTDISYATPQNMKNIFGHVAYVLNGAGALTRMKRYHVTVRYNKKEITDDFIYGMVVSSESIGGIRGITGPDVSLNDGEYELFMVRDSKALEIAELVSDILRGNYDNPCIIYERVQHVEFVSDEAIPWTLDGEYGGTYKSVEVAVHNKAVTFMTPKSILGIVGGGMLDKA